MKGAVGGRNGSPSNGIAVELPLRCGAGDSPDRPDVVDESDPIRGFLNDKGGPLDESLPQRPDGDGEKLGGTALPGAEFGRSMLESRNRKTGGAGAEASEPAARDKLVSLILW